MAALCRQPVGSFIIRDSTSYPGYYGLAIKTDMSGVNGTAISSSSDSIRHFLIETSVRGARIKGSPAEPHYSKAGFQFCTIFLSNDMKGVLTRFSIIV